MITVCHVITRMILGGAQENTLLTVRGLHEDPGYEVDLISGPALGPEGELLEDARSFGVEPIIVNSLRREINPYRDLLAQWKLFRLLGRKNYDIVHTHSSKAGIIGRWAGWLRGIENIVHTIHGLPFHAYQPWWKFYFFSRLEKITGKVTDQIQTVCDRMAEKAKAVGIQPRGGYRTVYSGMQLDSFLNVPPVESQEATEAKIKQGFAKNNFVFGKIARLFPLKGHKFCLSAFARVTEKHPQARLLLVGNGILRDKLEKQAEKLGIRKKVKFAGLVPYHQIPDVLTAMDCLVHTSLREGLPRVIPQAQAAGRPVISFAVDGAPEAIEEGQTGFLVPPKDIKYLTRAMVKIIKNPELRRQFVDKAREWVVSRYEWQHMVNRIKECYEHLLSE